MTPSSNGTKNWVLRLFAGSWATLFGLAAWQLSGWHQEVFWLPLLGTLFFAIGLVRPEAMRRPYRWVERRLAPVGRCFALLMLAVVYFGIFAPFAMVLRLLGWDPLHLRRGQWPTSGWVARSGKTTTTDYHWQY